MHICFSHDFDVIVPFQCSRILIQAQTKSLLSQSWTQAI